MKGGDEGAEGIEESQSEADDHEKTDETRDKAAFGESADEPVDGEGGGELCCDEDIRCSRWKDGMATQSTEPEEDGSYDRDGADMGIRLEEAPAEFAASRSRSEEGAGENLPDDEADDEADSDESPLVVVTGVIKEADDAI